MEDTLAGSRGGVTFDAARDEDRLNKQARKVWQAMSDGKWHLLSEVVAATGYPEASVSARLRDFRKPRFGGHTVEREYVANGLWMYRLKPRREAAA